MLQVHNITISFHTHTTFQINYQNDYLETPEDGVIVHGLFIDAGRWDFQFMILVDANKGEMIETTILIL